MAYTNQPVLHLTVGHYSVTGSPVRYLPVPQVNVLLLSTVHDK
jgi:hypothetical protein